MYRTDVFEKAGINVEDAIKIGTHTSLLVKTEESKTLQLIASAADVAQAIIFTTVLKVKVLYFDKDTTQSWHQSVFVHAFSSKEIRDKGLDGRILAWSNEWYESFTAAHLQQLSGAWLLGHQQLVCSWN